ncbi:MAG: beta-ketoacyl-ACP synthase II [Planctomycetota bacterium]|nr:beta-ketoacyl-ACP synthase II [Planctomycetota bacterium]
MRVTSRRVVVTGSGCITPLGNDVETVWKNLLAGQSGIAPITKFDTEGMKVRFGGEIKDFNPADYIEAKKVSRLDPFSHIAIASSIQAAKEANLDMEKEDRWRVGCIVASGIGGLTEITQQHKRYLEKGPTRTNPFFIPKMMLNSASGAVAIELGLGGPNWGISSACASANHALGSAYRTIQYGDADVMLAGGSESALVGLGLNGFANMQALSMRNEEPTKASRPFDKNRDGFVMGEGAAMFVLESLEHAQERGATILAEIKGIGNSDDAYHITAPDSDGSGAIRAMENAIQDAGIEKSEVAYVNAHGTSTPLNDKIETLALKKVFGDHAKNLAINSTKSMTGHLLGAAAAVEFLVVINTLNNQKTHPTINYETPDPDCDLDYIPNEAREIEAQYALSNSLGFGGHNSVLIAGRFTN